MAVAVHHPKVKLRTSVSVIGGASIPLDSFFVVLGNALPVVVQKAQVQLRASVSLICS